MKINLCMLAVVLAIALHTGHGQDAVKAFPRDTCYVLSIPDIKAIERDLAQGPGKLWQEPEVRAFWHNWCELKVPALLINPECFCGGRIEAFFSGMHSLAAGMYFFENQPHTAAVVGTSMDHSSFNSLISAVLFEMSNFPIPLPVFSQKHKDRTYYHILNLLFWTFVDDKVVIGDNPEALELIVANLAAQTENPPSTGTIQELEAFKTLMNRAGANYRALFLLNWEQIRSSLPNVPINIPELAQVKTLAVASIPSANGTYDFVYLEVAGNREGWLRLPARGGVSLDLLKLIPDESVLVAAFPLEVAALWETLERVFGTRLDKILGVSVDDLSAIGEEGAIFATCRGTIPDVFLIFRVRDRERMERAITAFIDRHNARVLPVSRYEFEELRQRMLEVREFLNQPRETGTAAETLAQLAKDHPDLMSDPWGRSLYLLQDRLTSRGPDGVESADDIDEAALGSAPPFYIKRAVEKYRGRELCTLEFSRAPGIENPPLREILAMAPSSYVFLEDYLVLSQRLSLTRYLAQNEAQDNWASRFFPGFSLQGGFIWGDLGKIVNLLSQTALPVLEYQRRKEALDVGWCLLPPLPPGENLSRHFRPVSIFYRADSDSIAITMSLPVSFSHFFAPQVLSRLCHGALAHLKFYGGDKEAEVVRKLKSIFQAEIQFRAEKILDRDGDGEGEFAVLAELSGRGTMRSGKPSRLYLEREHSWEGSLMISRGYCYLVYLPGNGRESIQGADVDPQEQRFICYAWPYIATDRPQRIFAVTQEGTIWVAPNKKAKYFGNVKIPAPEAAFTKTGKDPSSLDAPMGGPTHDRESWVKMYRTAR